MSNATELNAPPAPTGIPCAGVPATPSNVAATGGLSSATITWDASATSAYYLVELLYQGTVKKSARVQHRCAVCAGRPSCSGVATNEG